jgi:hypothetical protein
MEMSDYLHTKIILLPAKEPRTPLDRTLPFLRNLF